MNNIVRGIKNTSYLAVGTLVSQLIQFFSVIYVARWLGPELYGVYTAVGAFVGAFSVFTFSGLNKVVLRACSGKPDDIEEILRDTVGLRNLALVITVIISSITAILIFNRSMMTIYVLVASINLVILGLHNYLSMIYQAVNKMKYIALFSILSSIITAGLSISVLYFGYGILELIIVQVVSSVSILIFNYQLSKRFIHITLFPKIILDSKILRPAAVFSLLAFLTTIATRIDLLMLTAMGSSEEVGIYGIAYKIVQRFTTIRNIIATAYFPIFVKHFAENSVSKYRMYKYSTLFMIGILVVAGISSMYAERIVLLLFGSEYISSARILSVLILAQAFNWATIPFTTAAQATHNENQLVWILVVTSSLNILFNYILYNIYGIMGVAYSTILVLFINGVLVVFTVSRGLKKRGHIV